MHFISATVYCLTTTLIHENSLSNMRKILRNLKYQNDTNY